mmetsp:Transcript_9133/g.20627  ORF Transcript_9133/g.20627 Transcript_9133/m.20627 type:complete len:744 (+) Transcript_9133:192-2423(+)|eukprot:CAMPEP_0172329896 /NCGR_PEP_ID=MMETSP1058-20130122/61115_1 /TAXON_ID=83371 /ORGANISM="Detonula confervacea, Strain CCMP 353" /LENGTH=743 /DNA_ID=CAMNT_0013047089 /DNA_START=167 /DNA_END=2398 /DNA_ORIENTATION=-
MVPGIRKRSLLAGLLIVSSCHHTTCSDHLTLTAVVGGPSLEDEGSLEKAALHDAENGRFMESVASAVRSSILDRNFPEKTANGGLRQSNNFERKRRKTQQRRHGQQNNDLGRDLIVGGSVAPPGRFPYVVSLQLEKVLDSAESGGAKVSDLHTCGGTLIAMDVVLTAGHCGYEELPSSQVTNAQGSVNAEGHVNFGEMPQQIFYGADVGAYNLTSNDGGGYTVDNMLFEKLVLHPEYTGFHGKGNNRMSLQHDVMLVKLYGASDQPLVRLHNPNLEDWAHHDPTIGEDLVVTGWGDTDPASGDTSLASALHAATVSYVSNDDCEDSKGYSSIQSSVTKSEDYFEYEGTISDDMMCALGESQQDACQGDSGGGLIRLGDDFNGNEDVQVGIVSWGLQCGDEDFPGVYARVGEHYDWIAQNVCELSDSPPSYFNCPAKPYPPGSPYDPVVELTITIRFDDYRSETAWLIESIPDFRNIVFRPFDTYKSKTSVDENNSISESVRVHSGRFYMLSLLDEFADGFCCTVGEGFFRVDSATEEYPIVETTPGILWSPHALRRAFYVSRPNNAVPPNYVTIVVSLGVGSDPGKFLLVALENVHFEALMLYEIRPFVIMNDSRAGTGTAVYTRMFQVPVFGVDFNRQRYNVMVYDDNEGEASKANFEVYLGDARSDNLILAQSGSYGEKNNISRSFVLFKKQKETPAADSPTLITPLGSDIKNMAPLNSDGNIIHSLVCLMVVVSFVSFIG